MSVTIGAKPESGFTDPIGLLGDCHRRIERFLSILHRVAAESGSADLSAEHAGALEAALRYFRDAAPKHTADEEESLFPRLRRLDRPGMAELLEKVTALEEDHAWAAEAHHELDRLGSFWLARRNLSPNEKRQFHSILSRLSELYRRHIAMEDDEVFPLAAAVLSPGDRITIGQEMAARRGITPRT